MSPFPLTVVDLVNSNNNEQKCTSAVGRDKGCREETYDAPDPWKDKDKSGWHLALHLFWTPYSI